MKKIFPYILILSVVLGIFTPAIKTQAEDPKGTCNWVINGNNTSQPRTLTGVTFKECKSNSPDANWRADSDTSTTASCIMVNGVATNAPCTGLDGKTIPKAAPKNNTPAPAPTPSAVNTGTYTLLAPLPCPPEASNCELDANGNMVLKSFDIVTKDADSNKNTALGAYLNVMIKIFLGIAAVLAMVMVVMGGIQYMTSELISSKEAGKQRITNAVFGLLLAMGSYLILNTINPDLLKTDLGSFQDVEISIPADEGAAPLTTFRNAPVPATGALSKCSAGIQTTNTTGGKFQVCGSLALILQTMINQAWAEGIKIYGGGFRTAQEQIALRRQNCKGDTSNPGAACTPPTATAGNSMHESGLAFDFTCEGQLIQARDNKCFVWLNRVAVSYGLKNFSKEAWHWSTTGR